MEILIHNLLENFLKSKDSNKNLKIKIIMKVEEC